MLEQLRQSIWAHASKNAFCIEDQFYTYQFLQEKTCAIIDAINALGGSRSGRVGIVTTNSISTYASILACWYTGNAYVPLSPTFPPQRNAFAVEQADIDVVLGPENAPEIAGAPGGKLRFIDTVPLLASGGTLPDGAGRGDDALLYILFTSGSTGTPKGVPINYENVVSFIDSYEHLGFGSTSEDRFLQMFDLTFDVSVASYLVPLLKGACIYTVSSEGIKYMNVVKVLRKHRITFASIVPSIINYLKPYFKEINLPDLKFCILTAEASGLTNVKLWAGCMPNGKIVNLYGPTEATIWCTGYFFDAAAPKSYNEMLGIGQAFKNVRAFILDESGKPVKDGEKGELCIESTQLTPGYLNNKEKNQQAFFQMEGKRLYKTGDLCYRDGDGDILYCGRIDHQVKIQGFRIELSEIEVASREFTGGNCIAVVYKNKFSVDNICLFLEKYSGEITALKKQLEGRLPYYMIPTQLTTIEELPHNTSGKVDRVTLSKMASGNEN